LIRWWEQGNRHCGHAGYALKELKNIRGGGKVKKKPKGGGKKGAGPQWDFCDFLSKLAKKGGGGLGKKHPPGKKNLHQTLTLVRPGRGRVGGGCPGTKHLFVNGVSPGRGEGVKEKRGREKRTKKRDWRAADILNRKVTIEKRSPTKDKPGLTGLDPV